MRSSKQTLVPAPKQLPPPRAIRAVRVGADLQLRAAWRMMAPRIHVGHTHVGHIPELFLDANVKCA